MFQGIKTYAEVNVTIAQMREELINEIKLLKDHLNNFVSGKISEDQ